MSLLEINEQTPQHEASEAANSRYFFAREALMFSEIYWLKDQDLMRDDTGVFLQTGVDADGQFVNLEDGKHRTILTAGMDGRGGHKGVFEWAITIATPNIGREVTTLKLAPHEIVAQTSIYDAQGRKKDYQKPEDAAAVFARVSELIAHPKTKEYAADLRQKRDRQEAELFEFTFTAARKYAPKKFEKMVKDREATIKKIGFVQLGTIR